MDITLEIVNGFLEADDTRTEYDAFALKKPVFSKILNTKEDVATGASVDGSPGKAAVQTKREAEASRILTALDSIASKNTQLAKGLAAFAFGNKALRKEVYQELIEGKVQGRDGEGQGTKDVAHGAKETRLDNGQKETEDGQAEEKHEEA